MNQRRKTKPPSCGNLLRIESRPSSWSQRLRLGIMPQHRLAFAYRMEQCTLSHPKNNIVYTVDVGTTLCTKTKPPRFAWAKMQSDQPTPKQPITSTNIEALLDHLTSDLSLGWRVALGFESPMSIPIPRDSSELSRSRRGESNRSWSAPAGLAAASLGLHQSTWILHRLRERIPRPFPLSLNEQDWRSNSATLLFCWEAFVSKDAHGTHVDDTVTAIDSFERWQSGQHGIEIVHCPSPLSLLGVAALWAGWTDDLAIIKHAPVAIRALSKYDHQKYRPITTQ